MARRELVVDGDATLVPGACGDVFPTAQLVAVEEIQWRDKSSHKVCLCLKIDLYNFIQWRLAPLIPYFYLIKLLHLKTSSYTICQRL